MKKLLLTVLVLFGLQTQAQNFTDNCDSIGLGYITTQDASYPFQIHAAVMPWVFNMSDSLYYNWAVCVGGTCYSSSNMAYTLLYHQMSLTDTVKACYEAVMFLNNEIINSCYTCDSLIFNGGSWVVLNNNPTSINELTFERINDNKIYDLLGREIVGEIPNNTMYIKNGKKYIQIK
jgi:hypothetical protein